MYRSEPLKSCVSVCSGVTFTSWLCISVALGAVALEYIGVESGKIMAPRGSGRSVGRCTVGLFCLSNKVNA